MSEMPIYEYQCDACGRIEEAIQSFSDKPLSTCKFCSGKLHKLISQSSFHLKGSGWYVTDYSKKSSSKDSSTPKSDSEKSVSSKKPTSPEKSSPE
jgi:putative FmdB family regulatory protein